MSDGGGPHAVGPSPATPPTCYRHHDRATGVICQRCDRPICVSCQNQASVGVHCPECVKGTTQRVYTARTLPTSPLPVTIALIALNVAAYIYTIVVHGANIADDGDAALTWALRAAPIDAGGEWWRLITSGFGHFGLWHIGINMFSLYRLGEVLERRMGSLAFAVAYFASMFGGDFGALLLEPLAFTMGASGAIFGLLGLLVVDFVQRGISLHASGLLNVLLLNGLITFSGFFSVGGHVGGFVLGLVLGAVFFGVGRGAESIVGRDRRPQIAAASALAALMFVASLWAAARGGPGLFALLSLS